MACAILNSALSLNVLNLSLLDETPNDMLKSG